MLDSSSSSIAHASQNVALILLSFAFLPIDTFLLIFSYGFHVLVPSRAEANRRLVRSTNTPSFRPRTVLVTGVGMTKGLCLARLFYAAGHTVIGADFEPLLLPLACGRTSKALKVFYKLAKAGGTRDGSARYTQSILEIIKKEQVDIWISCSGVASAVDDGMAKEMVQLVTDCKAVQYDVPTTKRLHEKHSFIDYTSSLGLTVPETLTVTSKAATLQMLRDAQDTGRKYILKYIGTDDAVRGDMTLLPLSSPAATKVHISRFEISEERPWILQQYIQGPEYCTHSLVVKGDVKAFVACPSAELLMHYEALPPDSTLSRNMLRFTQEFAAASGSSFTGHLSFDFLVDQAEADSAARNNKRGITLYPIECNPRAHTAVALFRDTPDMVDGYLSLLEEKPAGLTGKEHGLNVTPPLAPVIPEEPRKFYWVGHDLVELVLLPLLALFSQSGPTFSEIFENCATFAEHCIWWQDGTYELWDPLPAWWLYHVYWPSQFFLALVTGFKWSRVNVSTTKMFGC